LNPRKLISQTRSCSTILETILWKSLVQNRPADRILAALLREHREYGSRDRRLVSTAVFSAFRWWGWLRDLSPAPFRQALQTANPESEPPTLPAETWCPFLLALFLMEDAEVPPIAAFWAQNSGVKKADFEAWRAPAALVDRGTAVLRLLDQEPPTALSLDGLIPEWALAEMKLTVPVGKLVGWLQQRPPLWLRAQTDKVSDLIQELRKSNLTVVQHNRLPNALQAEGTHVNLYTLPSFRRGRFEVQDLASQVIGLACNPKPGERWWDACAGAGGKTLLLADLMKHRGTVVASDIRSYKLDDLKLRARRRGFPNIHCRPWDGKKPRAKQTQFDGVLVDSPCTCSGTWRRNPDARWSCQAEDVRSAAELQFQVLGNAAPGVGPGGVLVYATCSMFEQENSAVVQRFLEQNHEFVLEEFANPLTGTLCPGTLQVWPWDGNCDAMFVARFRRRKGDAR
jgi:16S rRNA (cytosine967-C5)-methyltransferase